MLASTLGHADPRPIVGTLSAVQQNAQWQLPALMFTRTPRPVPHVRATGVQALLDPTRPVVEGRQSLFYGVEALTREVSSVHIADREYQFEPILVLGNPGVAVSCRF